MNCEIEKGKIKKEQLTLLYAANVGTIIALPLLN